MRLTYDAEAQAVYVYLTTKPVTRTEEAGSDVYIDFDAEGEPVGIEVLNVPASPIVEAAG